MMDFSSNNLFLLFGVSYIKYLLQIACVDRFVHHVNSTLHQQHEEEKLQAIVDKIEPYDAVDAPNDECLKVTFIIHSCISCLTQSSAV